MRQYRCIETMTIASGTIEISAPTMVSAVRSTDVSARFTNQLYRPTASVHLSAPRSIVSGTKKLFQLLTNRSTKIVAAPVRIIGSTTWKKVRISDAPSSRAASSSSSGTVPSTYTFAR